MTNIMNTKSIYIPLLLTGLLAGCGKKNGDGGSATIQKPARPASKLKEVKAEEAWKTPLNLALFTAQQYKGERGYEGKIQAVVFALVESGELGQATEVALLFPSEAGDEALARVVRAAAESGDAGQAFKVAQWIDEPPARARALCQAAMAQVKAGDKKAALTTIRQAEGLARKISQKQKARVLIGIAEAKTSVGEKQPAVVACEQALKLLRAENNDLWHARSYERIARVFIGAGEIQKTKGIIKSGNSLWDKTVAAGQRKDIAVIMAEEGELEAALEWIGKFPVNGTPDQQKKDEAHSEIAMALARQGKTKRAMEVMNRVKIRMFSWRMDLGELAGAMAEAGKLKEAMEVIQQTRGGANEETLRIIAKAQLAAGQKEQALETLKQAEQKVEKSSNMFVIKHVALKTKAIAHAEAGEKEKAVVKLKAAVEAANVYEKNKYTTSSKEHTISTRLMEIMPAAIKVGDQELTTAILNQAVELAQKASTLHIAAQKIVQAGLYQQAMETVRLIEDAEQKKSAMRLMAEALAMIPDPSRYRQFGMRINYAPMKKDFTPEEQKFAKQLVKALQPK